ncbi:ARM repeat-containing protein [Morchella conica CCBAS932]|uniref:ARM repeat-containing protein n=1 Tax=Morchella conica CCBAS932 TaxID=1392247 RepID=A0A3N4KZY3_9PEZI|nr:ARM repeat-containing protein [Morchella conica CCBAS932]
MAAPKRKQDNYPVASKKPKYGKEFTKNNSKDGETKKSKKELAAAPKSKPVLNVESDSDELDDDDALVGIKDDGSGAEEEDEEGDEEGDKMNTEGKVDGSAEAGTGSSKSKEAHAEQKRLAAERKQAKPLGNILIRGKKIWEQIRRRQLPAAERKGLIEELSKLIKGNVKELVFKHDASRIVQTALKYGDKKTKENITLELKGTYVALAQSSYGKYMVVKLMHYGSPEMKKMVVEEFYGSVRKLIKHREASFVIEDCFREYATPAQKAMLLREFYGVEFAIFKDEKDATTSLKDILEKMPDKRAIIMKSLFDLISGVVEKGAVFFTIVHKAMLEYISNAKIGTPEVTEFIELVKEHVHDIAFTKDGTQVVMRCLALGTAKDRKVMIKQLKPVTVQLATSEVAFLVLVAVFETVDDTVLVAKSLLPEFQSNFNNLAIDKFGRIAVLYPFAGRKPRLLPPSALPLLKEIDELRQTTSKKDPETRQSELRNHFSPVLIEGITGNAEDLCANSFGCQFIIEVLLGATGDKASTLERVAEQAAGDPTSEGHIVGTAFGGRMLKTLVAGGHYNPKEKKVEVVTPPINFHNLLYPKIKPHILSWATGAGSFIVVGLLETEGFEHGSDLRKELKEKKSMARLKSAVEDGNKGSSVILEALE